LNGVNLKGMNVREDIELHFPDLESKGYKVVSPYDPTYNCIAWATGDSGRWWEPDPMGIYYWPPDVPREYSITAYRAVFEKLGFSQCDSEDLERPFQKVAIYAKSRKPTHASRQLESGQWASKMGKSVDIEHPLQGLSRGFYGDVDCILRK